MELELARHLGSNLFSWQTWLALFCLVIYCLNRFNSWTIAEKSFGKENPPRHYTTKNRYYTYALLYTLTICFGYLLLLSFPNLLGILQEHYNIEAITKLTKSATSSKDYPLVLLIVLMGVLPTIKPIAQGENRLRSWFHRQAFIPTQAMALIIQLMTSPNAFQPTEHASASILDDISDYLPPDAKPTEASHSIWHKWFKLLYLRHKITLWQQSPEISQFNLDFGKAYQEGNELYISIKSELKYYAKREQKHDELERLATEQEREYLLQERNSLDRLKGKLNKEIDQLLEATYQYICCGILSTWGSRSARKEQFKFFNLQPKVEAQMPFVADSILCAMFFVFVVTSLTTIVDSYISTLRIQLLKAFSIGLLHTFMQGSCIFLAMFLFNRYRQAGWLQNQAEQEQHRDIIIGPMLRGLIGAVVGYCAALPIFAFWLYIPFDLQSRYSFFGVMKSFWYWPIPVSVTAYFIICYLVKIRMEFKREHDHPDEESNAPKSLIDKFRKDTWGEGFVQAGVQGLMAYLVCLIHAGLHPESATFSGQLIYYVVTTLGLTGWCIGRIFPKEYQRILVLKRKERRGEIPVYFEPDKLVNLRNRRNGARYKVEQPVTVIADRDYLLDAVTISISGAELPLELPQDIGTNLRLNLPETGSILGTIVRKSSSFTYLHFVLTESDKNRLADFLAHLSQPPAEIRETATA